MANDPHLPAPLAPAAERLQAIEHAVEAAVEQAIEATEQSLARRFGSGCVRALRRALALLLWSLVAAYFVFGALLLAARYWVMPRIDEARPWLERQVAAALKTEVRIGRIEAGWQGFNPRLLLSDVRLHAGGDERLALPQVEAVVSWASVPRLGLRFASLSVLAPELEVRRLAPGRFEVAGFVIEPAPAAGGDSALLDWLLAQHRVSVRDARILYVDQTGAEPQSHQFSDVNLLLEGGFRGQRFALQARPPAELASLIDLRGDFDHAWLQRASDISQWRGRLFAQFEFADLALIESLARVLPPPYALARAQGALRLWIDVDRNRLERATADVALVDVDATLGGDLQPLQLASLRGRITQREWGNLFEGGQEVALTGFSLQGPQLDLPPTDLRWRHTRADDGERTADRDDGNERRPQKTEIEASTLSLDTLSALALHVPLARDLRQLVEKQAVRGTLSSLRLALEGPLDQPLRYAARTRFAGLSMQAQPADPAATATSHARAGLPGFDNLAGSIELTERGGTLAIDARDTALEFPGVFEQPSLSFDRLTAQLRWNRAEGRLDAWLDSLAAANADLELSAAGSWRRDGSGPGSIELSGRLPRIDVAAVPGYLPLVVGPKARAWLQRALVAGRGTDGSFRLRGDLREFPFRDPRSGDFRIAVRARDAVLDYLPAAPREDGGQWPAWPRIEKIDADVLFERQRMEITARSAQVYGTRLAPVSAVIADLGNRDAQLQLKGAASGPAADMLRFVADSPLKERLPLLVGASANGSARLELGLLIPLAHGSDTEINGSVQLQNNDITLRGDIPPFTRAAGRIDFTRNSLRLTGINTGFVGGLARIDGATRADGALALSASGSATPAGVRRAVDVGIVQRLLARASGSTRYAGTLVLRAGRPELRIDTDLTGWAIDAPAPLGKSSSEVLPLRVELLPGVAGTAAGTAERDAIRVSAGSLLNVRFERVRDPGGELRIERGVVAVGENAPLPARGVLAYVNLPRLDADAWLPLLDTDAPAAVAGERAPSAVDAGGMPEFLTLRTRELLIAGKPVANVVAGATRTREGGETVWQANVVSDHVSGALTWRPATAGGSGRVSARLARLTIPESQRSNVAQILDAPPTDAPGFDVVADSFELGGRSLGRLELVANNVQTAAGPAWVMQKLEISNPDARMSATGQWQREPGSPQRRMALTMQIDFSNAGALLARLGIPDAMKGGQGRLEGELAWRGSPFAIHYPTLSGQLKLATSKGQFLKADAGAGRLLGVVSLQSLPRRISLDFRDVFSEGFAFDSIGANAVIKGGVLSTTDFRMRGVSANVLIEGSIDLRNETQNLHVLVLPEVNAGSASLVYALMANPAIGLGTFLAQMLLRDPLSKAFSFEYDVSGSWADPQVKRRERVVPEATSPGGN